MRLRTHVVANTLTLFRRPTLRLLPGVVRLGTRTVDIQKEEQVSDNLKEKAVGTTDAAPVGAKDGTLGAKDSVKRSVAKGGAAPAPTGAKDSAPVGAKDGTLGAKD
jgi:hypothetical protein